MLLLFKGGMFTLFCFTIQGCSCYQNNKVYQKKIKPLKYFGVVKEKFLDSLDRGSAKVIFQDGSVIYMNAHEMYRELQFGDTIIKDAGSLEYILKRNGETKIFYIKCDGKEVK